MRAIGIVVAPIAPAIPEIGSVQAPGAIILPGVRWEELLQIDHSIFVLVKELKQMQHPPEASDFLPRHANPLHAVSKFLQADPATAIEVHHPEGLHGATN